VEEVGSLDESLNTTMDWDLLIRLGQRFGLQYVPAYLGALRVYPEVTSLVGRRRWTGASLFGSRESIRCSPSRNLMRCAGDNTSGCWPKPFGMMGTRRVHQTLKRLMPRLPGSADIFRRGSPKGAAK
jgi:hypothetical protein